MKKLLALIIKDITFNRRNFIIMFIVITALIFINASEYSGGGSNIVNYLFTCGAASMIAAPNSFGIEDDKIMATLSEFKDEDFSSKSNDIALEEIRELRNDIASLHQNNKSESITDIANSYNIRNK